MNINRTSTAVTIGLFGLLTISAGGVLDTDPDDMHWPTIPSSVASAQGAPQAVVGIDELAAGQITILFR